MKEETAIKVLKQVKEVFDEHGIVYWLDQGTLLGAVRDRKFIPWDHDIDLGTWQDNAAKIFSACQKLRDKGFNVRFSEHNKGGVDIVKEEVPITINSYRLIGDKAITKWFLRKRTVVGYATEHLLAILSNLPYEEVNPQNLKAPFITMNLLKISKALPSSWRMQLAKIVRTIYEKIGSRCVEIVTPSHYYTNLSTITFYGMEFKVPAETEQYLTYKYGEDWDVPKRDWDPNEEDGAVIHANRQLLYEKGGQNV